MTSYSTYFNIPGVSQNYSKFRPTYPNQIYEEILSYIHQYAKKSSWNLAVDVACGPGLCTQPLGKYFKQVIGLDYSHAQITEAKIINQTHNVQFQTGSAYELPCDDNSVDLVTCAQALHCLDEEKFFAEVERVLKPGTGCLALYSYKVCSISNCDKANQLLSHFINVTLRDYFVKKWYNDTAYGHVILPYCDHTKNESMSMTGSMSLEDFINFIKSWATYHRLLQDATTDPLPELRVKLQEALMETTGADIIEYRFPVFLLQWRKP
ncbi:uncharacterized protein TRIADDRAFT_61356 [Trichoplax adhaerens]|uniref:Methyltransferase type 11 domain-containing protein n=2 Tax=Trichoplax adhaerens TaxID=10228 RepID=B3SAR8_TRIAD|nr:hypothetical protein TRIADDRAFT_61356 [Trichoplax adhaerens]EDV20204.1 hypothetical protein TRIADDRAFT_61356 [Trichoplax adhaerens]|eukprot:XP_002117365.1 hypothetical protein TRIADDRAFT_61356 [Trichoplax adhaerens]